jgi:hypothetical protein
MNTVRIHNHGPDGITVVDGNGQITTMGEGSGNVFATPVTINDAAGAVEDYPVPYPYPGPADEAEPTTEFEPETA